MTRKAKCILAIVVLVCSVIGFCASMPMPMQTVRMVYEDKSCFGERPRCVIEIFSNGTIQLTVDAQRYAVEPYGAIEYTENAVTKRKKLSKQDRDSIDWLISQVKENSAPAEEGYVCETAGDIDLFAVIDGGHYTECYQEFGGKSKWLPALAAKVADVAPDLWYCKLGGKLPWTTEYIRYDYHKDLWQMQ